MNLFNKTKKTNYARRNDFENTSDVPFNEHPDFKYTKTHGLRVKTFADNKLTAATAEQFDDVVNEFCTEHNCVSIQPKQIRNGVAYMIVYRVEK